MLQTGASYHICAEGHTAGDSTSDIPKFPANYIETSRAHIDFWNLHKKLLYTAESDRIAISFALDYRKDSLSKFMQGGWVFLASSILEAHGLHEMQLNLGISNN